jgi:predicted AAA+ superfamily ATPase
MMLSASETPRGYRSGRVAHPFARDFAGRAGLVGR